MLINGASFLLDLLFELVIFVLLAIFVTNLFKEYALPILRKEIQDIKDHKANIKNKKNLLKDVKVQLQEELESQSKEFFYLDKKVSFWNASFLQNEKDKKEEYQELIKKIKDKRVKQKNNLALLKMQEIVIPRAEKEAFEEIEKRYEGKKGEDLLKELIKTISPKTN